MITKEILAQIIDDPDSVRVDVRQMAKALLDLMNKHDNMREFVAEVHHEVSGDRFTDRNGWEQWSYRLLKE